MFSRSKPCDCLLGTEQTVCQKWKMWMKMKTWTSVMMMMWMTKVELERNNWWPT